MPAHHRSASHLPGRSRQTPATAALATAALATAAACLLGATAPAQGHGELGHDQSGPGHQPGTTVRHVKVQTRELPPTGPAGGHHPAAAAGESAKNDPILAALKAGNQRFAGGDTHHHPPRPSARRLLADQHHPQVLVIGSDDSRVIPESIFDQKPGVMVTVRTPGLLADPATIGLVERAVARLGIRTVIVLADDGTGPLADVLAGAGDSPATAPWRRQMAPALRSLGNPGEVPDALAAVREEAAHATREALLRQSPILRDLAVLEQVQVLPARYHTGTGVVEWLPPRPLGNLDGKVGADPTPAGDLRGPPPHTAFQILRTGHRRFASGATTRADLSPARREQLRVGSMPFAVVHAPADMVCAPELLFDLGLGELRTIRTPAGVTNHGSIAGVDWAVRQGGVGIITVLTERGHWAITAAMAGEVNPSGGGSPSPNYMATLQSLKGMVREARARLGAAAADRAIADLVAELCALRTVRELRERSPWVHRMEREGALMVVAAVVDPSAGDLRWLPCEPTTQQFSPAPMGETQAGAGAHGEPSHTRTGHDAGHRAAAEHGSLEHETPEHETPEHGALEHALSAHGPIPHAPSDHEARGHGAAEHGDPGHGETEHGHTAHGDTEHGDPHHSSPPHNVTANDGWSMHGGSDGATDVAVPEDLLAELGEDGEGHGHSEGHGHGEEATPGDPGTWVLLGGGIFLLAGIGLLIVYLRMGRKVVAAESVAES